MSTLQNYHIHVYFNRDTIEKAKRIATSAAEKFDLPLGRFHERPVGPHPEWSVQLLVSTEKFPEVSSWMKDHHAGLSVLLHENTGDDLADHTEGAQWLGEPLQLKTDIF
jgi:aromatic ring-cleaving dioxygenase